MRTIFLLLLCSLAYAAQAGAGFANLQQGPHGVGFRVVQQYDYSRSFKEKASPVSGRPTTGERARPMQTLVWYPARKGGASLRYADYMRTEATDVTFERKEAEVNAFMAGQLQRAVSARGARPAQAMLDQRMWAVLNAPALAGRFPVVIYAAGGGSTAHESADLCEYLASHGYLVLASRNLGSRTRDMNFDQEGLSSQARDIQFLLSYALGLPQADGLHVAAAGWSWGGLSNVLAASQDNRISALVSFDGTREPELAKRIPPTQLTVPWLYVQRRPQTISELNKRGTETSFSLLNEVKYAELYQVVMHPMEHNDFSSESLRLSPDARFEEYSRAEVEAAHHWTCRYTLEFLNAHLKGDAAGLAFLGRRPAQNGAPAHMATMRHTAALPGPLPTRAGFAAALAARGFGQAPEVYRQLKQQNPTFVLADDELNNWGYQLIRDEQDLPAALAIFRLATALYPDNANLFDSLGEADELNKDLDSAITHYRRSLELNPENSNAAARLKALAGAGAAPK